MNNKRTFFQYVIPSVLSFALSGVYAIVDGFFVGNSIGDAGLSAINIAYPITAVLQSVGTGIGMGGSVKYSILKAAGNEKKAREFVAGATWLMLLFSAVLTVTVFFTSEKILSALGASGELLTLGYSNLRQGYNQFRFPLFLVSIRSCSLPPVEAGSSDTNSITSVISQFSVSQIRANLSMLMCFPSLLMLAIILVVIPAASLKSSFLISRSNSVCQSGL